MNNNPRGINQYTGKGGAVKRAARIRILETRLNSFTRQAPLRMKVAVTKELRSLGWGRRK